MPNGQVIHLYTLCWNDARMLPFFFRHYDSLVDRYFMYDNGSTDDTLPMLRNHPKVTTGHFDTPADSFVEEERRLSDSLWLQSRGKADWVLMIDLDELLFRPRLLDYLSHCAGRGVTATRAIGYDMVSDRFPSLDRPLLESVTIGARSMGFDKLAFFNPDAIESTNFEVGRHGANPEGRVVWPDRSEIQLLHFKQMGVDYPIARSAELRRGIRQGDIDNGWAMHYCRSAPEIARVWASIRDAAVTVPGLGDRASVLPEDYDSEYVVRCSGLFDVEWYLKNYPDVREAGVDALSHFCSSGWKEGRRPNFYVDCEWYMDAFPSAADGICPLLHYIRIGAARDLRPSVHFDAAWYRYRYGLDAGEQPLRHYLVNCASGTVAPVPGFNVEEYCASYPVGERESADPYEDHCLRTEQGKTT